MKILLLGFRGIGFEIAKNLMISGVGFLTIYDSERDKVSYSDLSANLFLNESHIGMKSRISACRQQI